MKKNAQLYALFVAVLFCMALSTANSQNYSLSFDGTDDFVSFGSNSPAYSSTITIEAWIKTSTSATLYEKDILSWGNSNVSIGDNVQFRLDNGKLTFGMHDVSSAGDWVSVTSNQFINNGEWMHVAVVKDGTNVQLYINGIPDNSTTIDKTMNVDRMVIGAFYQYGSTNTALCFNGSVDEVRLWNSARTPWQLREYMYQDAGVGPVALYKANNGTGTTLTDNSGNGKEGSLQGGASWEMADWGVSSGTGLTFDGVNDHIWFPSGAPAYPGSFTIEGWIKSTSSALQREIVCWGNNSSGISDVVEFRMSGGKLEFGIDDGSWESLTGTTDINTGNWTHVAVTKNGSSIVLYINGIPDESRSINKSPNVTNMEIGNLFQANNQQNYYFPGSMDEIRIWSAALTQSELKEIMYRNVNGNWSNLLVCYKMNQGGTQQTLYDQSGNYHHGYMNNFSLPASFTSSVCYVTFTGIDSENWSTGTNWNSFQIPTTSTHVNIVDGFWNSPVLQNSASVYNLHIGEGAGLIIDTSGQLTVSRLIINEAGTTGLVIKADTTAEGSLLHNTPGISATVQTAFEQNRWHGISSPVSDAHSDVFDGCYLKYFGESDSSWNYVTTTTYSMIPGKGFFTWKYDNPAYLNWEGTLNNGDVNLNLSYTPAASHNGKGWNLVGNPFPSSVDFDGTWSAFNIDGTIYLYNGTQYVNWNGSLNTGSHGSGHIPPCQAFWVHANGSSPSIEIPQDSRIHSSQDFYKSEMENVLSLEVSGNAYRDEINIVFRDDATMEFDPPYDGYKLSGIEAAPQLYMQQNGINYSLNCIPAINNLSIPVMLETGATGLYTLKNISPLFTTYTQVILEDLKTGDMIDLQQVDSYGFQSEPSDEAARFLLHFTGVSESSEIVQNELVHIYTIDNKLVISSDVPVNGNLAVYDLLGKRILFEKLEIQSGNMIPLYISPGFYIVNFNGINQALTRKILIK
ncbi:MAG: T9SS type A sorting domain-containing protein [Bacteroidales bacterium]|nr:T9SS type A sorting domain-containing protein [Bacteroidales bacterium]